MENSIPHSQETDKIDVNFMDSIGKGTSDSKIDTLKSRMLDAMESPSIEFLEGIENKHRELANRNIGKSPTDIMNEISPDNLDAYIPHDYLGGGNW